MTRRKNGPRGGKGNTVEKPMNDEMISTRARQDRALRKMQGVPWEQPARSFGPWWIYPLMGALLALAILVQL